LRVALLTALNEDQQLIDPVQEGLHIPVVSQREEVLHLAE
jgi:hypothetical protein